MTTIKAMAIHFQGTWSRQVSNLRPSGCGPDALPLSYRTGRITCGSGEPQVMRVHFYHDTYVMDSGPDGTRTRAGHLDRVLL